ncbi:hypothetical protein [Streptomyces sp. 147326]|uniref:hypothetical protein n=1 Tax=Streptomyces sp. 147326 TaxID=3074379 RepID=UPI0038573159
MGGRKLEKPRTSLLPGASTSNERLTWRFAHVDHDGPWGFDQIPPQTLGEILRKLRDCESLTLNELRRSTDLFKEYELPSGLCKEALDRLSAMGRELMPSIHRLRFQGKQRLYGFLDGNTFHVVWWDPEHQVYPSAKRNT